jgi:tetratricopeptide (TPR) repeat protein
VTKSANTPIKTNPVPRNRTRVFAVVTLAGCVVLLLILEVSLRFLRYGSEYDLVSSTTEKGQQYLYINPSVGKRYFDPSRYFLPKVERTLFEAKKSPETFRVFCLGASTTAGFPYSYNLTPSFILKKRLEIALPGKRIEVVNAGLTATSSYTVRDFARELTDCKPDVFVIYTGQNEFYGALGAGSTVTIGQYRWLTTAYSALRRLKTFVLLEESIMAVSHAVFGNEQPVQSGTLMEQMAKDKAILFGSPVYQRAMETYRKNLEDVLAIAKAAGIPVVLSTLVTNERSLRPFVSIHNEALTDDRKLEVERLLAQGEALQRLSDDAGALEKYRKAAAIDGSFALISYRMGQCYDKRGDVDSARIAYGAARDLDGLRFRASAEENTIVRSFARPEIVAIADVDSAFRAHSPGGILGSELLWEHVHPTHDGYFLLSAAWFKALASIRFSSVTIRDGLQTQIPDSLVRAAVRTTALDEAFGAQTMEKLLHRWPFEAGGVQAPAAQTDLQRAASLFINSTLRWSEAHYEYADALLKRGDRAGALREYEAVNTYYPDDVFPLTRMGDMYALLGEKDLAADAFERVLTAAETHFIHLKLGVLYAQSASPDRALAHLSRAFELDAQSSSHFSRQQFEEGTYYYSLALYTDGRLDEAKQTLSLLLQNDPTDLKARRLWKEITQRK